MFWCLEYNNNSVTEAITYPLGLIDLHTCIHTLILKYKKITIILSTQYPFYIFYHFESILFIQNNLRNQNGSGEHEKKQNNSDVVSHIKSSQ